MAAAIEADYQKKMALEDAQYKLNDLKDSLANFKRDVGYKHSVEERVATLDQLVIDSLQKFAADVQVAQLIKQFNEFKAEWPALSDKYMAIYEKNNILERAKTALNSSKEALELNDVGKIWRIDEEYAKAQEEVKSLMAEERFAGFDDVKVFIAQLDAYGAGLPVAKEALQSAYQKKTTLESATYKFSCVQSSFEDFKRDVGYKHSVEERLTETEEDLKTLAKWNDDADVRQLVNQFNSFKVNWSSDSAAGMTAYEKTVILERARYALAQSKEALALHDVGKLWRIDEECAKAKEEAKALEDVKYAGFDDVKAFMAELTAYEAGLQAAKDQLQSEYQKKTTMERATYKFSCVQSSLEDFKRDVGYKHSVEERLTETEEEVKALMEKWSADGDVKSLAEQVQAFKAAWTNDSASAMAVYECGVIVTRARYALNQSKESFELKDVAKLWRVEEKLAEAKAEAKALTNPKYANMDAAKNLIAEIAAYEAIVGPSKQRLLDEYHAKHK